jgi:hypothetical protein
MGLGLNKKKKKKKNKELRPRGRQCWLGSYVETVVGLLVTLALC